MLKLAFDGFYPLLVVIKESIFVVFKKHGFYPLLVVLKKSIFVVV